MKVSVTLFWLVLVSGFALVSGASAEVLVKNAYIRQLPPGVSVTAVYLGVENLNDQARTLVGASSGVAERVEIHEHSMAGGKMRMRKVDQVNIPAHGQIHFKPGGYHIMLFGLQRDLKLNEHILLKLKFANGEEVSVIAQVVKA